MKREGEHSIFLKNVITLISGNIVAFIFPILLYPLLTRLYTPEDYALFGLYVAVFSFLEVASVGRYDMVVVMPEKDEDAVNIVAGGFLISLIYALIILLLVIFFRDWVSIRLNNTSLSNWLLLLPVSLILISVSKLCNGWLIRFQRYKASSINKAGQKISEGAAQLFLGTVNLGSGLIVGDLAGRLFNAVFSLIQSKGSGLTKNFVSRSSIKEILVKYSEIPKYGIMPSMLNTLAGMQPVFVVSTYYSVAESGSFNFSRIILSVPFALISAGISQVLMQQVSEKKNKKISVSKDVFSLAGKLSLLSIAGIVILYLTGPELFELIFGVTWRQSGHFTSILIFSYAVTFIVSPFSILLIVMGKIKLASIWQIFYFILISVLWFLQRLTIDQFLSVLVLIDLISYLFYGYLIVRVIKDYEKSLVAQHT